MLFGISLGAVGVVVALVATVPAFGAWWSSRRNTDARNAAKATAAQNARDDGSWQRMLDSVERTERDLATTRREVESLRAELATVSDHARRCDAELAELRDRLNRGGTPQ